MALAACRECGQQVSTEADSCPHCGARSPVGPPSSSTDRARSAETSTEQSSADIVLSAGWVCFGLGMVFLVLSLGLIFVYAPLFLASFVLSIVVMVRGRTWSGVSLLITTSVVPAIAWIGLLAWGLNRAFDTGDDSLTTPLAQRANIASAQGTTEGVPHYAPQATNIRSGPSTSYRVVLSLTPGEVVYIGTPDGNGWSAVLRDGDTVGYVLGRLLRSGDPSREARSGGSTAGREVALRVSVSNMTESQALGSPEVWLRGEGWWRPDLAHGGDVTTFEGRKLGTLDTLKFYPFGTSGPEMIVVIAVDAELCPQGCARDMVNFEIWEERFLAWGSPIEGHEVELRR